MKNRFLLLAALLSCAAIRPADADAPLNARLAADLAAAHALESRVAAGRGEVQVAGLFGKSDEELAAEAAAAQREQAQDASIATLTQKLGELEDTLRRLTGQVEELDHRVGAFDQRIERLQKDFDAKLCALSAQQLGAATAQTAAPGDATALPCNPGTAPVAPAGDAAPGNGAAPLAPPPGVLGTLPQNALPAAPPDTHSAFEVAMSLLAKAQYDAASAAFRNFADTYPQDALAAQALYWIGDIAYVQKDYASAARAFAEELKKYPSSSRAPESMLKLGQALLALNQKKEGCTTLSALAAKFPGASKNVVEQAEALRKAGGCRH